MPGVKGFFTANDIPGDNDIGPVIHDEELFATTKVKAILLVSSYHPDRLL